MSEDSTVSERHDDTEQAITDGIVALDAPAPPFEPEGDSRAGAVELALRALTETLAEHQRLIGRQADIAANLHAENQRLRAGELRQAQAALVTSVLRVLDDVTQMAQIAKSPESRGDLALVADALTDALERNGVLAGAVEPGTAFDARAHRIALVEATPDPAADRTVARVVRPGFSWADGSVIRLTDVAVFRHTPDPQ